MGRKTKIEKQYEQSLEKKFKTTRDKSRDRPRCPNDGMLIGKNGKCWLCGWSESDNSKVDH
jgi:hypothetical protein